MLSPRQRPVVLAVAALAVIWLLAWGGYTIAKHSKITPDKVRAYVESVDFSRLSPAERAKALKKLAAMLNALSLEERRSVRLDRAAYRWFEQMTEEEKGEFLEATMPTGFKQMLNAFEEMPEDKRRRFVDQALKQMKESREKMMANGQLPPQTGANGGPGLSEELQKKVTTIGLKSFYSQSSAQTKAEMAPLLEEMQRMMEFGERAVAADSGDECCVENPRGRGHCVHPPQDACYGGRAAMSAPRSAALREPSMIAVGKSSARCTQAGTPQAQPSQK